jgi:hypothetical protein
MRAASRHLSIRLATGMLIYMAAEVRQPRRSGFGAQNRVEGGFLK